MRLPKLSRLVKLELVAPCPLIFVSAVSRELRSARQLVANTLTYLGYEPVWQDVLGTESGDLRTVLRQQIDQCKGVVQLIGQCYGAEPPTADEQFGRVSYTQYEALSARQHGKKVWYLFIDDNFPTDAHEPEPDELRELQAAYRRRVQADAHIFHPLGSREALEASVLKLRDDLVRLRRGVKQWAAAVALLLVLIVGLVIWLLRGQATMATEMVKLREGLMQYPRVEAQLRSSQSSKDTAATQEQIYAELGKQLGVDAKLLREKLPQFAQQIRAAPDAASDVRARAAYVNKDYSEAERLALKAAEEAKKTTKAQPKVVEELKLAGSSAGKRAQFETAIRYFREAEKLTDRKSDPKGWEEVQKAIAGVAQDLQEQNAKDLEYNKSVSDLKQ